jgi:hypothetical protein
MGDASQTTEDEIRLSSGGIIAVDLALARPPNNWPAWQRIYPEPIWIFEDQE